MYSEFEKLLTEMRTDNKSAWQCTRALENRRRYNSISNNLTSNLRKLRNALFQNYTSKVPRQDNSNRKPIIAKRNKTALHPIRKYTTPQYHGQKADEADLYALHLSSVCGCKIYCPPS